ncbi:MAG: hypothetical protein PHG66_00140 [Candidatus Colwellbacteria bacterium]|nr:hypothetical protein [Candidatus Colwellbacteria bacterium]
MALRRDSDIEIDNELKKYMIESLDKGQTFNSLTIDSVVDGCVRFISWMRFPVNNNFMIFNMVLDIPSSDTILNPELLKSCNKSDCIRPELLKKKTPIKSLQIDKTIISKLVFDYMSYCNKDGVLITNTKMNTK